MNNSATTQATPLTLSKALDNFATAVAARVYWEDNGSHGDGRLAAAQADERAARREVTRIAKAAGR